jgi:hypothetical protein
MADPAVHHLTPVENLRAAYLNLEHESIRSLLTQVGDAVRLGEVRSQAIAFLQAAETVCHINPPPFLRS